MKKKIPYPLILLAAGKSSRMGAPKGLVLYRGRPWIREQLSRFGAAGGERVYVVLGYDKEDYLTELPPEVCIVINPQPERGPFSSLRCALDLLRLESAAYVQPVDVPVPGVSVWSALAGKLENGVDVCVPTCEGKGGHPVLMGRRFMDHLESVPLQSRLDEQIQGWEKGQAVRVPVEDPRVVLNLNTPGQMEAMGG